MSMGADDLTHVGAIRRGTRSLKDPRQDKSLKILAGYGEKRESSVLMARQKMEGPTGNGQR
jgi:hypothetical protein